MKHVTAALLVALLIGLVALKVAASRSHRPQHVSDSGVRKAEGKTPAPALLPALPQTDFRPINGAGRLGLIAPESPSFERHRRIGLVIPDDTPAGRLEMPGEGKPGSEWQELVIPD